MLVLTREVGQSIRIGPNVRILVTRMEHGKVRLAIDAPPAVRIDREEIARAKDRDEAVREATAVAEGQR